MLFYLWTSHINLQFDLGLAKRWSSESNLYEMHFEVAHCISVQEIGRKIGCSAAASIANNEPNATESSRILYPYYTICVSCWLYIYLFVFQQQPQQSIQPQIADAGQCHNYVYVECTPTVDTIQEVRQFDGLASIGSTQTVQHVDYTGAINTVNTLQPLPNGYTIQNLHVPSTTVHFQTYNVPIQLPTVNHLMAAPLTQIAATAVPMPMPLQSIVHNHNPSSIQPIAQSSTAAVICDKTEKQTKQLEGSEIKQECDVKLLADGKTCSICSKEFLSTVKLARHMKTHVTLMPYRCKICQKGFSHNGNFKVHMRMHNDERPYQCTMCDRACRQLQDLEKHIRTHTGEKPHVCDYCNKGFSTSSNLIAHMRTHTGEKPYVCSVCQKAFCQSNELTKHTRTHTGEKSHTCKLCHKGFNGSSPLVMHMRTHTGERPYICRICQKGRFCSELFFSD